MSECGDGGVCVVCMYVCVVCRWIGAAAIVYDMVRRTSHAYNGAFVCDNGALIRKSVQHLSSQTSQKVAPR